MDINQSWIHTRASCTSCHISRKTSVRWARFFIRKKKNTPTMTYDRRWRRSFLCFWHTENSVHRKQHSIYLDWRCCHAPWSYQPTWHTEGSHHLETFDTDSEDIYMTGLEYATLHVYLYWKMCIWLTSAWNMMSTTQPAAKTVTWMKTMFNRLQ